MTRGWGEVARVCRTEGALAIHFEYDGASTMFFKVFDEEGCRLECGPGGGRRGGAAASTDPAAGFASGSSSSSGGARESSDSPEPSGPRRRATTATTPRALAVPGARPQRLAAAVADLDGVGAGLRWPTVDDGIVRAGACR